MIEKRGRRFFSKGLWAPRDNIVVARAMLAAADEGALLVALSQLNVASALHDEGQGTSVPAGLPLPQGACAARAVATMALLHRLVRRAFQLGKALAR